MLSKFVGNYWGFMSSLICAESNQQSTVSHQCRCVGLLVCSTQLQVPNSRQGSLRLSTLLSETPAHFDNFELGGHLVKTVELKSKNNIRMLLKLWQKGLEHGLSRITKESLLEQLTGQREEPEAFEILGRLRTATNGKTIHQITVLVRIGGLDRT